jgi:hypothetical protein
MSCVTFPIAVLMRTRNSGSVFGIGGTSDMLCDAFFPASYQLFNATKKEILLVERVTTDAPLFSHHHLIKIVFPLKLH